MMELFIDDDGVAREYRDDYDITIHCESKEDQDKVWSLLTRQWIPVTDRLPEDDHPVLVTLKWAEDDYEVSVAEYWHNSTEPHGWGNFENNVVAWRPLPEPWEGEKE